MEQSVRSAIGLAAVALLMSACSSDDEPYAHGSQRHPTAAEQLFGTTGGSLASEPLAVVVTEPAAPTVVAAPSAPATVPQTVAMVAPTDAAFAQRVAASNVSEIELARIAYIRAQSSEVRAFARQMLIDHRQMAINLDNFALERSHLVAWRLEPEMASTIERLRTIDAASFDRAYMDAMVSAHERTLATLEGQAASGRETASLASASLPTVRHHLEMARALDVKL
jgi:putative membrane protein